ncbi:MAG: CAP domain-containing protein [Dissulfurispiraceae bacterium]|jgi:uncharacterized protein YkwD
MKIIIAAILFFSLIIQPAYADDTYAYLDDTSQYIYKLLNLINHYRESKRLKPLSFDNKLTILAQNHSADMQRKGVLSHDRFDERFKDSGHNSCVENVAKNYGAPRELFAAWQNSIGHDKNMLATDIKRAGISRVGTYVTFFACN